jgi:small secreted domain DUF320
VFKKIVAAVAITGGLVLAGAGVASAEAASDSSVTDNPGIANGIVVQTPISVPVNVCGVSVPIVGLFNPVTDNVCIAD